MILYFADRTLNIIGQASTGLPKGLTVIEDLKTEDIETGVAVFECKIPFTKDTRTRVEECTEVGNYLLRSNDGENEFYTIIDAEIDTKNQEVYIYAEDAGLDLLNEVVGAYEADKAYAIDHYINKFAYDSGFVIGINEAEGLTRKLSWDGEATATERIASVATQFGGYEISFSFDIDGLAITNKYINIHKERGQDNGIQLRLNKEIDRIITKKSIANLATALECVGGTPDDENIEDDVEPVPITLAGYSYDDGDIYISGSRLYSRKALEKWSRYIWAKEPNQIKGEAGHIVKQFSYDTTSQAELCAHAVTELKKLCEIEVNYEVDFTALPAKIGDWVNIVDDAGNLYMAARVLLLETSVADQTKKATLGEYLIKSSGISQKVIELAAKFAKTAQSAARALALANKAKGIADAAQTQAESAVADANTAQQAAEAAQTAANTALESASVAQEKANAAQSAVDKVEESVTSLETTVTNAKAAADNAYTAAETAQAKADEAAQAAAKAVEDAADAKEATETAKTAADSAIEKAEAAQSTANTAKTDAESAKATAEAAKADAEQAEKDIAALGEELETVSTTMQTDYARKTDLTEATASLQSQITQNAGQISSTVSRLETIDETANSAKEQAEAAQSEADLAKAQADQATANAQAAQTAADNAAQAAANAQSEADTAKAAAETAQSVADKAEADLEAAKADLATVSSRVDATEEDIIAAQQAVTTAQTAADKAKADAQAAATKAVQAQSTADTAVTNAANAQTAADDAASAAALAQATADAAKGDAAAAQAKANEAATAAANAQTTANTAKTNAANAQAKADQAAADAATAQQMADDADARAAQAQTDLATAQQNLANVTSRVDATEEEVEAAKSAVVTAQAAADKAKADAEAAQATADTAKANAATAQTAANNAKTAADNAQKAADDAQKAADDAQAAVDALAVRVTTAETKITQNSEQIALMATKEEVTETLGGYYTKTQTDAAIQLKADGITSSVSKQFEGLQIGGRNLLLNSKTLVGTNITSSGSIAEETYNGFSVRHYDNTAATSGYVDILSFREIYPRKLGEEYTLSFYAKGSGELTTYFYGATDYVRIAKVVQSTGATTTSADGNSKWTLTDSWERYWVTWTLADSGDISVEKYVLFRVFAGNSASVCGIKLEIGNKATDWTIAPEETTNDIGAAQNTANDALDSASKANSLIEQLADSIAMLVTDGNGTSLMTQTETGWTFSTQALQNAVDDTSKKLGELEETAGGTSEAVKVLQAAVNDLGILSEYIKIGTYTYTDENGTAQTEPSIDLGEADSEYKLKITNTTILFTDGSTPLVKINSKNKSLDIQKAKIKELQIGGFVWQVRSNGNAGLIWKGVDS